MRKLAIWLLMGVSLLAACAPAGGSENQLEVSDVWGRSSPMAAENGAFYMTITNNTDQEERLLAARSDACGAAELHEMYVKEGDVMGMRPVSDGYIAVPAHETVQLKVGGLHVMCLDKKVEFKANDKIQLVLTFANAGERTVTADIRDSDMGG